MKEIERAIQYTIEHLEAVDSQPGIAVRVAELGKDPEATIDDYANIVSLSRSLSVKFIALANSSSYSPRRPITSLRQALSMIGCEKVRMLAISYCLRALYAAMELDPEDELAYWQASVCKAVSASMFAAKIDHDVDEAFGIALLQDIGVIVLVANERRYRDLMSDASFTLEDQLHIETETFGLSHAEIGSRLAARFRLPDLFKEMIAVHHEDRQAGGSLGTDALPLIMQTVAWLPHDIRTWKIPDLDRFNSELNDCFPGKWIDSEAFLDEAKPEYEDLIATVSQDGIKPADLLELIRDAYEAVSMGGETDESS